MKIAYLISHGHTARGAFQTNLLGKLKQSGHDVVVITKRDPEGQIVQLCSKINVPVYFYDQKGGAVNQQKRIFRNYVHQNIRKNPALYEKHQRRALDKSTSLKRKFINSVYLIAGDIVRSLPPLKNIYLKIEDYIYHDLDADKLLKDLKVDMVISTRPVDEMEAAMLKSAKRLHIKRVLYILSWDNITAKGIFAETGDYYLTWGQVMNEELKEYYKAKDENILSTGVTHFDIHIKFKNLPQVKKHLSDMGLNENKPYMFFTMSASYYCPNEIDVIEWLAKQIESNKYGPDMQLILRPHMHNFQVGFSDLTWKERLLNLQSKRVAIDFPEMEVSLLTWYMKQDDMEKFSNLLAGASITLNSCSTVGIEAAIMGKPVIMPMFDTEEWPKWRSVKRMKNYIHLKKFIDLGGADVVESFEELDNQIKEYINNPSKNAEKRRYAAEQECFLLDGRATDRFVENINKIQNKIS